MLKIKFVLVALLLPILLMAQKKSKETATVSNTIAYVEETVLLKALTGYEQNTAAIDSLKTVYTKEIQEAQTQLNTKLETLLKPYNFTKEMTVEDMKAKLKENDKATFELYIKENELITKSTKNYDLMLKTIYEQKVQPSLNKLNTTIETYAKEKGIKVVYTLENISPALAYIDKGMDITGEIVKRLAP